MGTFTVQVTFEGPQGQLNVDALVDTSTAYASLPANTLRSIGVMPQERQRGFRTPTGDVTYRDIGQVHVRHGKHTVPILVVFDDDNSTPVLGHTALACLGVEADAENERLVPTVLLMPSLWDESQIQRAQVRR